MALRGSLRFTSLGLLTAIIIPMTSMACDRSVTPQDREVAAYDAAQLGELGRELGVALPRGTHVLGVERERGKDRYIQAKLQLTDAGCATLLRSAGFDLALMDPGTGAHLGSDRAWWDPNQAGGLRTAQHLRDPASYLNIGVAPAGPNKMTVYIVFYDT